MRFIEASRGNLGICAAPAIFRFEKIGVFALGQALLKLFVDPIFAVCKTAPALQNRVYILLGYDKSGGFFCGFRRFLRFNGILLFFDSEKKG